MACCGEDLVSMQIGLGKPVHRPINALGASLCAASAKETSREAQLKHQASKVQIPERSDQSSSFHLAYDMQAKRLRGQ